MIFKEFSIDIIVHIMPRLYCEYHKIGNLDGLYFLFKVARIKEGSAPGQVLWLPNILKEISCKQVILQNILQNILKEISCKQVIQLEDAVPPSELHLDQALEEQERLDR